MARGQSQVLEDWLIDNGTGYDWSIHQTMISNIVDDSDIPNNFANVYMIADDQFAMMFKIMFADVVYDTPKAFGDFIVQKRLLMNIV